MLADLTEANQRPAQKLWQDLLQHLPKAPGSSKNHQAWEHGYFDHVHEVMNLAYILYERLEDERPLPFALDSALVVLFLHDSEKPFRHATDKELIAFSWVKQKPTKSDLGFQKQLADHYGFQLSDEELNGLEFVEGEKEKYTEYIRMQRPLAAFCHLCDVISARIWFDYPQRSA